MEEGGAEKRKGVRRKGEGVVVAASGYFGGRGGRQAVLGAWARVGARGFFVLSGTVARTVAGGGLGQKMHR